MIIACRFNKIKIKLYLLCGFQDTLDVMILRIIFNKILENKYMTNHNQIITYMINL